MVRFLRWLRGWIDRALVWLEDDPIVHTWTDGNER